VINSIPHGLKTHTDLSSFFRVQHRFLKRQNDL